ncbi:hypothetical protein LRD69_13910 [Streptomyces sp. JH14]|uniref:hypothetical protein n=1 Tax=Streptomyces sp. JH14 TaxID=2793630 RepID=UPI0023F806E5|nr:hypothetical protein [Streptomyces sp. JH14]MDF6043223.1 hypothetical protein [Streptomyces sp. JH14]
MPVTPTPTGWIACYRSDEQKRLKQPGHTVPVDGWSTDGDALVVDKRLGCRVPASSLPDFRGLEQAPAIVAVLPGQGWRLVVDGETSHLVLGWAIDTAGYGSPIFTDPDGVAQVDDGPLGGQLVPPADPGGQP